MYSVKKPPPPRTATLNPPLYQDIMYHWDTDPRHIRPDPHRSWIPCIRRHTRSGRFPERQCTWRHYDRDWCRTTESAVHTDSRRNPTDNCTATRCPDPAV